VSVELMCELEQEGGDMNGKALRDSNGLGKWWKVLAVVKVLGTLAILTACDSPTEVGPVVGSVVVDPAQRQLTIGDSVVISAAVKDLEGGNMEGVAVTWSVSDTSVARLMANAGSARVRAVGEGSVVVEARAGGRVGRAQVAVRASGPGSVARVVVTPQAVVLEVGRERAFTARAYDAHGAEIPNPAVTWINDSPAVISLTATGVATGVAKGYGQVTARVGGMTSSSAITVTAPETAALIITPGSGDFRAGQQRSLRAVLLSEQGDTLPLSGLSWSVEGATILSVAPSPALGYAVATGMAEGTAAIIARAAGLEARAVLRVTPGEAVGSMEMRPPMLLAEVGVPVTMGIHAWHPDGAFFADPEASWVSSDPTIALVDGVGARATLRGLRNGTVEVIAAAGGVTARATVTVKAAGPVGHVIVAPSDPGIWVGSLYRMTAATLAASGADLPGQPVAWTVEDTTVATIEADGLLLTKRAGTTRVLARSGGKEGVARIRVYDQPGARMVLDLDPTRGPDGEWRPTVSLGTTTWTDPMGIEYLASRFLVGGRLEVDIAAGSRWSQDLEVETVVVLSGGPKVVARTVLHDEGTWSFRFPDPWHLDFVSTVKPWYRFEGSMPEAGRFVVRQALAGANAQSFTWMLR
jgi:uncharacterized protein YjdB